jgi:hypothetical protein
VASLSHPFIVPHIDSWIQQGHTVNTVYKYCEKGDLANFIKKQEVCCLAVTAVCIFPGNALALSCSVSQGLRSFRSDWGLGMGTLGVTAVLLRCRVGAVIVNCPASPGEVPCRYMSMVLCEVLFQYMA